MTRRVVRASPAFFDQLDTQLGAERGPHGEPSATDFLVVEVPAIVEAFAARFDELPEAVEGVPDARKAGSSNLPPPDSARPQVTGLRLRRRPARSSSVSLELRWTATLAPQDLRPSGLSTC